MTQTLGIDIGGSGIKGAPVDTVTGELLAPRYRIPTPEFAQPLPVAEVVGQLAQHFNWQGPIGCGFPAVVQNGQVYTAANIDQSWVGTNVDALFEQTTGLPVTVINDADAAGMAEMRFGAGRGEMGKVLIITLGTGIGTAIFVNGMLVPNLEMGHLVIRGKDSERRASDAARQAKGWTWEEWARRLTEYLNMMENLIWPDLIILGGGVSKQHELFFPHLRVRTRVVPAQFLNMAGIVGAAIAAEPLTTASTAAKDTTLG